MKIIKNIVIVAGGKNTRFEDLSIFPKVLLPINNGNSILINNYNIFKDLNIYLVINNQYYNMCQDYCKINNLNIHIIESNNINGSANTLKSIKDKLPNNNTLLLWSDLVINNDILNYIEHYLETLNLNNLENINHYIITKEGQYRFAFKDGKIINSENGNIPGIYFYYNKPTFSEYNEISSFNYDYVEYLRDFHNNTLTNISLYGDIIEFKDKNAYINYLDYKPSISTRFFNKMFILDNNILVKKCINSKFNHLIETEYKWYNKVKLYNFKDIPKIYSYDHYELKMEYLKGYKTIYNSLLECQNSKDRNHIIKKYVKTLKSLHKKDFKKIDKSIYFLDSFKEYVSKVIERCDSISNILIKYNKDELRHLLFKAFKILNKKKISKYVLFHGDPNGSNAMYNKELDKIKLIDPRGYFGYSKDCYGPEEYDYAKVLYMLSGYDNFNNNKFIYGNTNNPRIFNGSNIEIKNLVIPKELDNIRIKIIVSIIWISLAQYISQDIFKANIAYEYGLNMLKNLLKNY